VSTSEPRGGNISDDGRGERERALLDELRAQAVRIAADLPDQLQRVALRAGEVSVEVEWKAPGQYMAAPPVAAQPAVATPSPVPVVAAPAVQAAPAADDNRTPVTAPLVGTFYRASQPTAPPFVRVGDVVEPGQPLAIIEAMKLLNEIKSDIRARVLEIFAENGEIVEFGQKLMELEPVD
jgi:acetyl-CoA carboxylase biotin carboxyl carrier protein